MRPDSGDWLYHTGTYAGTRHSRLSRISTSNVDQLGVVCAFQNSLVALDVRTGKLLWYVQLVPSDFHDWDLTQVSPLVRATVACPGILGGVEWNGPAYDPGTGLLYVPAVDWCWKFATLPEDSIRVVPGEMYLGGTATPTPDATGWLTAVDVRDGSVRWRYHSSMPMVAAVTTTAGGLVFTGEQTGDFVAFDASSGRELYRFYTGGGLFGGIITYETGGRQFVAATTGGGSLTFGSSGSATLFVFALPKAGH